MDTNDRQTGRPAYFRGMPASLWTEATTRRQRTRGTTALLSEQTRLNITRWAQDTMTPATWSRTPTRATSAQNCTSAPSYPPTTPNSLRLASTTG